MASAASFSASGEDAITRALDVQPEETPDPGTTAFDEFYEIAQTVRRLEEGDYHRIALQFPDELLHDSVPISRIIKAQLGSSRDVYILADTSYGSCCVDEVTASHVDADVMVHYGHACMSQTSRLPVIYVFGRRAIDRELCVSKIVDYLKSDSGNSPRTIVLKHDVVYTHHGAQLAEDLRTALGTPWVVLYEPVNTVTRPAPSPTNAPDAPPTASSSAEANSQSAQPPADLTSDMQHKFQISSADEAATVTPSISSEDKLIVWIGGESPTLTKLIMTSGGQTIVSYSPASSSIQLESHLTNRLLMRRYALVQKARDADIFGILVGTLGVASYLPLIAHLRTALRRAHKKAYTVSVGKINPAKLANFMEIECWVWVACSECMVDGKDFLKPIVTPYELELALQPEPAWTGRYVLDFDELLAGAAANDGHRPDVDSEDGDRPTFSLITGKYRHAKRYGNGTTVTPAPADTAPSQALTQRSGDTAVSTLADHAAAHFLQARTYRGLDPRIGQDAPGVLAQGRSGIARAYAGDDGGGGGGGSV